MVTRAAIDLNVSQRDRLPTHRLDPVLMRSLPAVMAANHTAADGEIMCLASNLYAVGEPCVDLYTLDETAAVSAT